MATYIHEQSGTYPLYLADIRRRHKNISFPEVVEDYILSDLGYEKVHPVTKPTGDVVNLGQPKKNKEGKWQETWNVRPFTNEELSSQVNSKREALLREGILYTFPGGKEDRIQVNDRDLTILQSIEFRALQNLTDDSYSQIFRSMGNVNYVLTAQQVLDMTAHVFKEIELIYLNSWKNKL